MDNDRRLPTAVGRLSKWGDLKWIDYNYYPYGNESYTLSVLYDYSLFSFGKVKQKLIIALYRLW